MALIHFDYDRPDTQSGATCTAQAWAKTPEPVSADQARALKAQAAALLKAHNAVLVAHYYVDGHLQDLALETGGCVSDSLDAWSSPRTTTSTDDWKLAA